MRHRVLLLLAISALATGCLRKTSYESCSSAPDCAAAGSGARCESNHACSVSDMSCSSGYRYHGSAGTVAGECVPADTVIDTAMPDTPAVVPAPGRECVPGIPLPASYSGCATMVDGKEPRCGTEMWDRLCVRWAEQLCQLPCTQMAFIGADTNPVVVRLSDDVVLWRDTATDYASAAAWGDYDNDGDPDLAIVGDTLLRVYENKGWDEVSHTLTLEQVHATNWGTIEQAYPELNGTDVQWVDIDRDGDLDAVFAGYGGMVVARNQGNNIFIEDAPLLVTNAPVDTDADPDSPSIIRTAWGDADGDTWPDVAIVRRGKPHLFYKNDGHGNVVATHWDDEPYDFGAGVEWCNLDDDPLPELVLSGYSFVWVADNEGGKPSPTLTPIGEQGLSSSDIECADLDGDGDLDLFVTGDDGAPARAYTNAANKISSLSESWRDSTTAAGTTSQWNGVLGDLDGDHKLDVLAAGHGSDPPLQYQRYINASITNSPRFTVPAVTTLPLETQSTRLIAVAPLIGH